LLSCSLQFGWVLLDLLIVKSMPLGISALLPVSWLSFY
jgi:hypothetical protein